MTKIWISQPQVCVCDASEIRNKYGYDNQNMDIKAKNIVTQVKLEPKMDILAKIWISRPKIL